MSRLLKHYSKNERVLKVLKNPEKLRKVLFLIQEATDQYMEEARKKLSDPRRTIQAKAKDALDIAQAIIKAEKKLRELEMYSVVGLKTRGMSHITDV